MYITCSPLRATVVIKLHGTHSGSNWAVRKLLKPSFFFWWPLLDIPTHSTSNELTTGPPRATTLKLVGVEGM